MIFPIYETFLTANQQIDDNMQRAVLRFLNAEIFATWS